MQIKGSSFTELNNCCVYSVLNIYCCRELERSVHLTLCIPFVWVCLANKYSRVFVLMSLDMQEAAAPLLITRDLRIFMPVNVMSLLNKKNSNKCNRHSIISMREGFARKVRHGKVSLPLLSGSSLFLCEMTSGETKTSFS